MTSCRQALTTRRAEKTMPCKLQNMGVERRAWQRSNKASMHASAAWTGCCFPCCSARGASAQCRHLLTLEHMGLTEPVSTPQALWQSWYECFKAALPSLLGDCKHRGQSSEVQGRGRGWLQQSSEQRPHLLRLFGCRAGVPPGQSASAGAPSHIQQPPSGTPWTRTHARCSTIPKESATYKLVWSGWL